MVPEDGQKVTGQKVIESSRKLTELWGREQVYTNASYTSKKKKNSLINETERDVTVAANCKKAAMHFGHRAIM